MGTDRDEFSDEDSDDSSSVERISLNGYVSDNSSLFLVMGVFAALSVYISSVPTEEVDDQLVQLGVVTSLLISGLLAVVILLSLSDQVSGDSDVISSIFHAKNIDTIIFLTLFATLFYSILQIVTQEAEILAVVFVVILFVGFFAFILTIGTYSSSKLEPYIRNSRMRTSVTVALVFAISHQIMLQVNGYLYEEYHLYQFRFDSDVTITESLPIVFHSTFLILSEISLVIALTLGSVSIIYIMSLAGHKYERMKDLLFDH
ncbi:hypothetical protein [Natronobiforma cellulositropha]|uniref:hypothetical protein n=1 Tax=Natronobiforma cellulositropha TaxID=1679076 RepID=UPI0021D5E458|nr:hypothetical protein [Natronobiforma cellulositropha]